MRWQDKAIILGTKPHGETSLIVEVMSEHHGRHLGVVKGGRSRRMRAVLQGGNRVKLEWWARLDEHLGQFHLEIDRVTLDRLMEEAYALYAFLLLAEHLKLLPEREPHKRLYELFTLCLDHREDLMVTGELVARFELALLEELGFGLDLAQCALTGQREDLYYVSPRSGRAVSAQAGAAWHTKLMILPAFLLDNQRRPKDSGEILSAFALTGFFLDRRVWQPRGIQPPQTRARFLRFVSGAAPRL